jgi:hypothetical protein
MNRVNLNELFKLIYSAVFRDRCSNSKQYNVVGDGQIMLIYYNLLKLDEEHK